MQNISHRNFPVMPVTVAKLLRDNLGPVTRQRGKQFVGSQLDLERRQARGLRRQTEVPRRNGSLGRN